MPYRLSVDERPDYRPVGWKGKGLQAENKKLDHSRAQEDVERADGAFADHDAQRHVFRSSSAPHIADDVRRRERKKLHAITMGSSCRFRSAKLR
jgi:hypothetical protein